MRSFPRSDTVPSLRNFGEVDNEFREVLLLAHHSVVPAIRLGQRELLNKLDGIFEK